MTTSDTTVHCHPCGVLLSVDGSPVSMDVPGEGRQLVIPKFDAPFICGTCREDPEKLAETREEMVKYIGEPGVQGEFDG